MDCEADPTVYVRPATSFVTLETVLPSYLNVGAKPDSTSNPTSYECGAPSQAASVIAGLVAQHKTTIFKSDIQNYYNSIDMVMAPVSSVAVHVEVLGFRISGSTISQIWKTDNGRGAH